MVDGSGTTNWLPTRSGWSGYSGDILVFGETCCGTTHLTDASRSTDSQDNSFVTVTKCGPVVPHRNYITVIRWEDFPQN